MTRYLGGVIGGTLDRNAGQLNPADWTNTNITEDYSYIIPVPTSEAGGDVLGHEESAFGNQPGRSIAISGDGLTAVVGVYGADQSSSIGNTGAVFVYEWDASVNRWKFPVTTMNTNGMYASDREAGDYFGISVGIDSDGSTIAVGAYAEDTGGSDAGKVYIFEKGAGWAGGSGNEVAMLRTSTDTTTSYVGRSIDLSADGQTLIVGEERRSSSQGQAVIFEKPGGGWVTGVGAAAGQKALLTASDADASDYLGFGVAISDDGSTAVAVAYAHDGTGNIYTNSGAIYVYERPGAFGTWANTTEDAILTASDAGDGSSSDNFGQYAADISGDGSTIAIGKYNDDGVDNTLATSGAAYIYEKGAGWTTKTEDALFRPSELKNNDRFGHSVSLSKDGNTIAIGAPQADYLKNNALSTNGGAVYIYEKGNGWVDASSNQVAKLFSPLVEAPKNYFNFDELATTISITADGSRILAGGDHNVLVFHKPDVVTYDRPIIEENKRFPRVIPNTGILDLNSAGAQETDTKVLGYNYKEKLTASDANASDNIGTYTQTLAISRDGLTAIVGSPLYDNNAIGSSGAAYVYEYTNNSWTEVAKFTSSTGDTANDYFGSHVAISDNGSTIAIGAYEEDVGGSNMGAVFVFERPGAFGTWTTTTEDAYLHPASSDAGRASAVAMSGDGTTIFVGANYEHTLAGTSDGGAIYVFEKGAGWTNGSSNLTAELHNSTAQSSERMGHIVRCTPDGLTVAAGAAYTHNGTALNCGAVYIFEKGAGWTNGSSNQSAKLQASYPFDNDYLTGLNWTAGSLSISDDGNTVVAGAYQADITNDTAGKVYIWEKNGSWTDATEDYSLFEAGSTPSFTFEGASGNFGYNVHISGNGEKIFVAAENAELINNEENSAITGIVYVFEKGDGWKSRLGSKNEVIGVGSANPRAITSSYNGDIFFAGVYTDDTVANNAGAIYVYNFDNNATENRVLPRSGFGRIIGNNKFDLTYGAITGSSDWTNNPKDFTEYDISPNMTATNANIHFGSAVALSYDGTRYVVGAQSGTAGEEAAYIYDFINGRWELNDRISKPLTNGNEFGNGVCISDDGNTIAVTAYNDHTIHVYEYINNGWKKVAELTTSTAAFSNWARDVQISGDGNTIIAGAQADETYLPTGGSNTDVGGVWVWEKPTSGWTNATQDAILYAADRTSGDYLGYAINMNGKKSTAISTDGSIISASAYAWDGDQGSGAISNAGAIFVFKRPGAHGTWVNGTESAILEKDYLGSTTASLVGQYGFNMSADGNHIVATTSTPNNRIYIWEKSADSDWTSSLSDTYITLDDAAYSVDISKNGNTIIAKYDATEYIDDYLTYEYVEVYEKGAGWSNSSANSVRKLAAWRNEQENNRGATAISADGSVYAMGVYLYDRWQTNIGGSFVWDSKKYKDKPIMNKTGMFSLKDMYQSKLTES